MVGPKALRAGGLVVGIAAALTLGARVHGAPGGKDDRPPRQPILLAQAKPGDEKPGDKAKGGDSDLPGMGGGDDLPGLDEGKKPEEAKPAQKPGPVEVTLKDGSKVTGKLRDRGDRIVVQTKTGPVEIAKADIGGMAPAPAEPEPTPKPEEPKPAEPAPTPKPAEPAPMPKPEEPKPAEPAPTPRPTEPTPEARRQPVEPAPAEPAPSAVKPARAPTISYYPREEAMFGAIEPEHRGHVELGLYAGWDVFAPPRGIGVEKQNGAPYQRGWGVPMGGARVTGNFGEHFEYGVGVDFSGARPEAEIVTKSATVTGELFHRLTLYRLDLDFTYRLRFLRYEYITPYVSAGAGAVWINAVSGTGFDRSNPANSAHVTQNRSIGGGPNLALGIDYKLARSISFFIEGRDHLTFTKFNSDLINSRKRFNSIELVAGIIIHSSDN
jgi:hypothetical protein